MTTEDNGGGKITIPIVIIATAPSSRCDPGEREEDNQRCEDHHRQLFESNQIKLN
jgi:hypothetical protein